MHNRTTDIEESHIKMALNSSKKHDNNRHPGIHHITRTSLVTQGKEKQSTYTDHINRAKNTLRLKSRFHTKGFNTQTKIPPSLSPPSFRQEK